MLEDDLNYRHLMYFWTVGHAGGIAKAADRLGMSAQAVSTQVGMLEKSLGVALLAPKGRGLVMTEAGRIAFEHAERIFETGGKLRHALAEARGARPVVTAGLSDAVPKLVAARLFDGLLHGQHRFRVIFREGRTEALVDELALGRLDVVIAGESPGEAGHRRLTSRLLLEDEVLLYGTPALQSYGTGFPASLNGAPVLLPSASLPLRRALDEWFRERDVRPEVIAEFDDSALLKTFGRSGLGLFPSPASMAPDIAAHYGAQPVASLAGLSECWHALFIPRRLLHPAIDHLLNVKLAP